MKVYIVTAGCIFEGGVVKCVALTPERAIEDAERLVAEEARHDSRRWVRREETDLDPHPLSAGMTGDVPRIACWRGGHDFVAVHEWETLP